MSFGDLLNTTAQIEGMEWIIILVILAVLFLFGPSNLPELAQSTVRALGEFHCGRLEVEREINTQFSAKGVDPLAREQRAAAALGVTTTGKSDLRLKLDIARSLAKVPDNLVTAAAQALGIPATSPATLLREQMLKTRNG